MMSRSVGKSRRSSINARASRALSSGALSSVRYKRPLEVAAIARAMGLAAWIVDKPGQMQTALREALETPGPSLIEVRVDASIAPPLGDRVKSISGFIDK